MIEFIKCVGQIINICTQLVRRCLFINCLDHIIEFCTFQHQCFFKFTGCLSDHQILQTVFFLVFIQDRLDPDNCVQNVRSRVSFKGSKAVYIKDIILGCLIGKITIFDRSKSYHLCSLLCLFLRNRTVVHDLLVHLFVDLTNQIFQTHHAAFSCLKRLAVFSVHRTES